jgi:hypothetical protein
MFLIMYYFMLLVTYQEAVSKMAHLLECPDARTEDDVSNCKGKHPSGYVDLTKPKKNKKSSRRLLAEQVVNEFPLP